MRSEQDIKKALDKYSDMIQRICFVQLKNHADVEDIFQNVFIKYATSSQIFESEEHKKAWFIRVTLNSCKDLLKSFFRSRTISIDELIDLPAPIPEDHREVLEAVLSLPKNYRIVIYLYYFEDYSGVEIAQILGKKENTIYTWLSRAKKELREKLETEVL